jgi:hypothetical protein
VLTVAGGQVVFRSGAVAPATVAVQLTFWLSREMARAAIGHFTAIPTTRHEVGLHEWQCGVEIADGPATSVWPW